MKYQLFNQTKEIEIDDDLVKIYENYVHPLSIVSLQGMIAACGLKESNNTEISKNLMREMLESVYLIRN